MSQKIKDIAIKDLGLWTENPRDRIDPGASDQEIADRAINRDKKSKWSLKNLFNTMGPRFDQSEIPTVAYIDEKPIVFDGNRRVLIGKIIHGCVQVKNTPDFQNFEFPETIPCNVCDKKTALEHVDRKHSESGGWSPLERDIFKHNAMKELKSPFLIIEESTQLISNNPELNKGFVKDEIFDQTNLHKLGFSTNNGVLKHAYQNQESAQSILDKVIEFIVNKKITTRKNRGEIEKLLKNDKTTKTILKNKGNNYTLFNSIGLQQKAHRKTPISKVKNHDLFGKKLSLKAGTVNNLYSDLLKLCKGREKNYSEDFPKIIRMGMRLLCEVAYKKKWTNHLKDNFDDAKKNLNTDEKNTLHSQSVEKGKIVSLLQSGGHGYTASNNIEQTIAISLIVGILLENSHGKNS